MRQCLSPIKIEEISSLQKSGILFMILEHVTGAVQNFMQSLKADLIGIMFNGW